MFYTFSIYNFILIISLCFSYLAEHLDNRDFRFFSRIIVFLSLYLPASLRFGTGTDYWNYVSIFEGNYSVQKEIGWELLNKFVKDLGFSYQYIFVFSSLLIYLPVCFCLERKNFFYSILFYLTMTFYFKSYNIIRQNIAVSFVILALYFFRNKKFFTCLLVYVIGVMFHKSIIICIPLFFIYFIHYKNNKIPLFILFLGIVLLYTCNILFLVFSVLSKIGSSYTNFIMRSSFLEKVQFGSGIGFFVKQIPLFIPIIYTQRIVQTKKNASYIISLSIFYIWMSILGAQFVILGRLRDVFMFIPLLVCGVGFNYLGKYKKIVVLFIMTMFILFFEIEIKKQTRDVFSNAISPYYSIFEKESYYRMGY